MAKITPIRKSLSSHRGPIERNQKRKDGWSNLITSLGTGADKRLASQLLWENHDPEFFEQMYAGGGIPARIVDILPEECLRHWIEWSNVDKKEQERRNELCEQLDVRGSLLKAWKWGRAYGGGLLHIVTDTADPASPLRIGERVIGLRDLSRWDVRILTTDIEFDFGSPNWGQPRIYYLNVQMGSQYKGYPIHWTRMLRFDGQLVPRRTYIRNGYWHDSILNRLYNAIRNYETSNDAAAACLQDFNVDVFKMKNLANLMGAGNEEVVRSRIEMLEYCKSTLNAMLIDADEEDYENKARQMQGVAELLIHQANRLVADTDIPHTKLLGESPDGSNATGNSTSQQWYNFVGTEQENYLKPKLKRLFSMLFPDAKEISFKFRSLRVLDDTEKADLRLKVAQTDQIYIEQGVLDKSEVAESRFGGDEYSIETTIDKEARESGELIPGQQEIEGNESEEEEKEPDEGDGGKEPKNDAEPFNTSGNQPPEGRSELIMEPRPSEPEPGQDMRGHEGRGGDISGREPELNPKPNGKGVEGQGIGELFEGTGRPSTEFDLRNEQGPGGSKPIEKTFISQTMSEPMRDPRTDPHIKGPGIPNKPRTVLPTRGTGIMAPSGFDFEKDAGKEGAQREGEQIAASPGSAYAYDKEDLDEAPAKKARAATIIVRKGDKFLMGKTNKDGSWTLPGGHIEDGESAHQGAIRELTEETGLKAQKLKWLGTRLVESRAGQPVEVAIYEHNADAGSRPSGKNDPDKEVGKWQWFDSKKPLDAEVLGNLKHAYNVALDHMGLLK